MLVRLRNSNMHSSDYTLYAGRNYVCNENLQKQCFIIQSNIFQHLQPAACFISLVISNTFKMMFNRVIYSLHRKRYCVDRFDLQLSLKLNANFPRTVQENIFQDFRGVDLFTYNLFMQITQFLTTKEHLSTTTVCFLQCFKCCDFVEVLI